jgi:hypothetical protein
VGALDEAQSERLLRSFVEAPSVEYDAERILTKVAERHPALVLDFLETRIRRERGDHQVSFDPIPYRFHELQVPLSREPAMLLAASRRMFDFKPAYHRFYGARLVSRVFPTLTGDIADALRKVVRMGSREDLDFVLSTLEPYESAEEIYPICMDIIERLEPGDDMLGRVAGVLGETGVLTGDFGHVEAEGEQHMRLKRWLDDERPKVKAFVEAELRRTEQSMAWEQRRAEREVEQMRRDWGD